MPADSTASAKAAFSLRNPYPGWMASAPVLGRLDDAFGNQVGFRCGGRPNVHGFIRIARKGHVCIDIGVHRYALQPHGAHSSHDAQGNFAAVGDQDLRDGAGGIAGLDMVATKMRDSIQGIPPGNQSFENPGQEMRLSGWPAVAGEGPL